MNIKTELFKTVQKHLDFLLDTAKENEVYQTAVDFNNGKYEVYEFGVENTDYLNMCDYLRVALTDLELPIEVEYEEIENGDNRDLCRVTYAQKLEEPNSYNYETLTFYNLDTAFAEEQIMQYYQGYQK